MLLAPEVRLCIAHVSYSVELSATTLIYLQTDTHLTIDQNTRQTSVAKRVDKTARKLRVKNRRSFFTRRGQDAVEASGGGL